MILQCDQCQTKFRLDDSKLKPGGVKVRCSKCRHVFLAGAEQKQEESEFDALLSGLGGPAPEKRAEPAPADTAAALFGFDEEPAAAVKAPEPPPQPEPAVSQPDLSDFDSFEFPAAAFAPEKGAPVEEKTADFGGGAETAAAPATQELDFGEFSFSEEPAPVQAEQPERGAGLDFGEFSFDEGEAKAELPPAAEGGAFDFGEFDFDASPTVAPEERQPAADALDFGEFTFNEEPAPPQRPEQAQPAVDALDFGEISFNEEPPVPGATGQEQPASDEFDFGELSFDQEQPAPAVAPGQAPSAAEEFDFGEFSFDEEPAPAGKLEPAQPEADAFGDFSLAAEPVSRGEEPPPSAGIDALDFGDFTFTEEPPAGKEEPAPATKADFEFDDFTFSEEPPPVVEQPADDFGSFSFGEEPQQKPAEPVVPATAAMPAESAEKGADAGLVAGVAGAAGLFAAGKGAQSEAAGPEAVAPPVPPAAAAAKPAGKESTLDFTFPGMPEEFGDDEDLPPLGITSRRKGRSALTVAVLALSVLVILALSAAGIYVMKSGPEALKKLDQFGIGFVADWFGVQAPDEGRIIVKNPVAAFHQNKEAGELFVVTGEAVNSYQEARASVQVKVNIYDKNGAVLVQKTAYCGNRLTNEQLANLPMEKIESIMNNQFGDSLANLGIKPGQGIGFVVALANVPKEAADFGVEVVGSTVAGQ